MSPKNDENDGKTSLAVMAQQISYICKQVDDLHVGMYGLPEDPESGMVSRMQKIEIEKKTKRQTITDIAAWLALIISTSSAIFGVISTFTRY